MIKQTSLTVVRRVVNNSIFVQNQRYLCEIPLTNVTNSKSVNFDSKDWENAKPLSKIPGPMKIPGIGMGYLFLPGGSLRSKTITEVHKTFNEKYGDIVKLPGIIGRNDMIALYDPNDAAILFRTEGKWPTRAGIDVFNYFRKHYHQDIFDGNKGIFNEQGEMWGKMRSILNPIMLPPATVRSYTSVADNIACEFVEKIKKIRNKDNEVPPNFFNELSKWSLEVNACIALNSRLNLLTSDQLTSDAKELIIANHEFTEQVFDLEIMPSFWKIYKTPTFKKFIITMDKITTITKKYVDEAIKQMEDDKLKNKSNENRELSVFEKLVGINRQLAVVMALDMLFAGVDPTAGLATSMMYLLAKNPDKQEKLRQEILTKLPEKTSKITPDMLLNVPYLRACLKEVSRVKPVAPFNMRVTGQDLILKGYRIPKGTEVVVPTGYLQVSDKHYTSSDKFIPERWLDNYAEVGIESAKSVHPFVYLPFGFGVRTCIGKRFAELMLDILILRVLRDFRIEWHYDDVVYGKKMLNIPTGDMKFRFVNLK